MRASIEWRAAEPQQLSVGQVLVDGDGQTIVHPLHAWDPMDHTFCLIALERGVDGAQQSNCPVFDEHAQVVALDLSVAGQRGQNAPAELGVLDFIRIT